MNLAYAPSNMNFGMRSLVFAFNEQPWKFIAVRQVLPSHVQNFSHTTTDSIHDQNYVVVVRAGPSQSVI